VGPRGADQGAVNRGGGGGGGGWPSKFRLN